MEVNYEHENSEYVNNFMIGQLLGVQSPEKQRLLYNTACQKVMNASVLQTGSYQFQWFDQVNFDLFG